MRPLPYPLSEPPARLKKARLDNVVLVPASLLPLKGTYQPIANNLPTGSVLCVPRTTVQQKILSSVAAFFKGHGRNVLTLPFEKITKRIQLAKQNADHLQLSF